MRVEGEGRGGVRVGVDERGGVDEVRVGWIVGGEGEGGLWEVRIGGEEWKVGGENSGCDEG